jgi:hypothetical protein
MIIVIRFKYVMLYLISLVLLIVLLFGRVVIVRKADDGAIRVVLISFLPLWTEAVPAYFTVTSVDPRQTFWVDVSHSRFFKVAVRVRERRFPKGSPVTLKLMKLPTWFPGLNRSFCKTVLPRIKPAVLRAPPVWSGTRRPLVICFNTPLCHPEIKRLIQVDFPAKLVPCRYRIHNRFFTDYAAWRIIPTRPLQHHFSYRISLQSGITGIGGRKLAQTRWFRFTTVTPLKVVTQFPTLDSMGLPQYQPLRISADRELLYGRVWLPGYSGETVTHGKTLSFTPSPVLLPDTLYQARVTLIDRFGEPATGGWRFRTAKLAAPFWVEVNLRLPQTIRVYQGKRLLKSMPVSGPAPQTTRLRGGICLQTRGYVFYHPKLQEGAYYWLRLANGWLIHSVPFGADGQIKPGQVAKLGRPVGNGSIRLALKNIKWLYQNLPSNTPVIIHGPPVPEGTSGTVESSYQKAIFFNYRAEFERYRRNFL